MVVVSPAALVVVSSPAASVVSVVSPLVVVVVSAAWVHAARTSIRAVKAANSLLAFITTSVGSLGGRHEAT